MFLNCGVGEDSWESLCLQGDPTSPSYRRSVLGVHWKDWCWSWNSNTLATWCKELTDLKRPWCWETLRSGGEGDDRGWDGWMASPPQWSWVWLNSGSWWWTRRPGVLQFMELQRVGHNWETALNCHTYLIYPLFLLLSIFPSIRVFSNESALPIRWPKYWSFSFNISPSNEYPGLISFRMYWLDLVAVQGTLKSLLQHHSSKAPILLHSAFLIVQLSHPYMTTRKTIALTRCTFVGKAYVSAYEYAI